MIINPQSVDTDSLDGEHTWISLRMGNKTAFMSGLEVGATGSSGNWKLRWGGGKQDRKGQE